LFFFNQLAISGFASVMKVSQEEIAWQDFW